MVKKGHKVNNIKWSVSQLIQKAFRLLMKKMETSSKQDQDKSKTTSNGILCNLRYIKTSRSHSLLHKNSQV